MGSNSKHTELIRLLDQALAGMDELHAILTHIETDLAAQHRKAA